MHQIYQCLTLFDKFGTCLDLSSFYRPTISWLVFYARTAAKIWCIFGTKWHTEAMPLSRRSNAHLQLNFLVHYTTHFLCNHTSNSGPMCLRCFQTLLFVMRAFSGTFYFLTFYTHFRLVSYRVVLKKCCVLHGLCSFFVGQKCCNHIKI